MVCLHIVSVRYFGTVMSCPCGIPQVVIYPNAVSFSFALALICRIINDFICEDYLTSFQFKTVLFSILFSVDLRDLAHRKFLISELNCKEKQKSFETGLELLTRINVHKTRASIFFISQIWHKARGLMPYFLMSSALWNRFSPSQRFFQNFMFYWSASVLHLTSTYILVRMHFLP